MIGLAARNFCFGKTLINFLEFRLERKVSECEYKKYIEMHPVEMLSIAYGYFNVAVLYETLILSFNAEKTFPVGLLSAFLALDIYYKQNKTPATLALRPPEHVVLIYIGSPRWWALVHQFSFYPFSLLSICAVVVDRYKVYNVQLNDVWVISNGTAILKCLINPRFVNEYIKVTKWTQDSKPITDHDRVSAMNNGELHVRNVQDSDTSLVYRCVTRNILTQDSKTSPPASIHVHDPPVIFNTPNIETADTGLIIQVGKTAELPCVATGNPLPNYKWAKGSKTIVSDKKKFEQKGGNLAIHNLTVTDSGDYKCRAFNKKGSTTVSIQLTVTSPLSATLYPADQIVDAGRVATFNCSVQGSPINEITWYHNGEPLTNSSRKHIIVDNWLQLPAVNRNDQGMYQCIVGNDVDMSQATGELRLGAAHPAFLETFVSDIVQPGSNVTFKCAVSGNPPPTIRWTLDDELIYSSDITTIKTYATEQADVVSTLHITNIQVQTGGEYRCIGSNVVGKVTHMARANVYGVPYVRVLQNITATAKQPLIMKCYVSGYPIGSITWFKDFLVSLSGYSDVGVYLYLFVIGNNNEIGVNITSESEL
uniref:Ig-like domain-containing protein n=1 Tax=Octopus bimaculoides TaxID=37653 RepID=A0A0L8HWP1_OCTBM